MISDSLGLLASAAGMLFLLASAVGLVRLPDALSRQHAATKAGTVAVTLFAVGAGLLVGEGAWTLRLALVVALLLLTLPIGSHALSRAAAREEGLLSSRSDRED
jgi:multicomponent Na+:H+ antiporter subunit G